MTPDRHRIDDAVEWANTRLRSHGGFVEVERVDAAGDVELRFGGMCCGCPYKALTLHGTIRPALLAVDGVRSVDAAGARISVEAAERLARYTDPHTPGGPLAPADPEEYRP